MTGKESAPDRSTPVQSHRVFCPSWPSPGMTRGSARPSTSPLRRTLPHATNGSMGGWVYIMTNRPNGTLYVGVTSDLARRAWEHRMGLVEGFTRLRAEAACLRRAARPHRICHSARNEPEALAPGVEGQSDPRRQSIVGRSLRPAGLRASIDKRTPCGYRLSIPILPRSWDVDGRDFARP